MQFYTVKEIAEMLKMNEQTIFRFIREGKLEATKVGGRYRITQEQLDRFIKN